MANTFWFVDGESTSHSLYVAGVSTARFVLKGSEIGTGNPPAEQIIEWTGSTRAGRYRDSAVQERIYGFKFTLKNGSAGDRESSSRHWAEWHDPEKGEGYIYRITNGGITRCLDCVPMDTQWGEIKGHNVDGSTQQYRAANPYWRGATAHTASAVTSHSATVVASLNNGGDIPAWVNCTITGKVYKPRYTNLSGDYMEVLVSTSNADDEVRVIGRPNGAGAFTVKKVLHGNSTESYCAIASGARYATAPTGSHSMSVVCTSTSGSVTFAFSHYDYYRSL